MSKIGNLHYCSNAILDYYFMQLCVLLVYITLLQVHLIIYCVLCVSKVHCPCQSGEILRSDAIRTSGAFNQLMKEGYFDTIILITTSNLVWITNRYCTHVHSYCNSNFVRELSYARTIRNIYYFGLSSTTLYVYHFCIKSVLLDETISWLLGLSSARFVHYLEMGGSVFSYSLFSWFLSRLSCTLLVVVT